VPLAKTLAIFTLAVLGELAGTYAIWRWLRADASSVLIPLGLAALLGYAAIQTLQSEDRYGRLYAAYAGVFLVGATFWGWAVDGKTPDRFDFIGAVIVLVGVFTILSGRTLFA
jgi:small multidrug resistance family-3 protein